MRHEGIIALGRVLAVCVLSAGAGACVGSDFEADEVAEVTPVSSSIDEVVFDDGTGPRAVEDARPRIALIVDSPERVPPAPRRPRAAPGPDPETVAMERAAAMEPDELLRVAIVLPDAPFPWEEFRNQALTEEDRAWWIDVRKAQVAEHLSALEERLLAMGATNILRDWMSTSLGVDVPAKRVRELSAWPNADVSLDEREGGSLVFDGHDARLGMRTDAFINASIKGTQGNRVSPGTRIRVGLIESGNLPNNFLNFGHFGFMESGTNPTDRVIVHRACTPSCAHVDTTASQSHGTSVARVLAGSIEEGQDPAITDAYQRRVRSGIAPETSIHYWNVASSCGAWNNAVADAQAFGVDVLNISAYITCLPSGPCQPTCDCGGLNTAIANATAAGMLVVAAVGNDGDTGSCLLTYPAMRRDVLAIGALDTEFISDPDEYDVACVADYSNRGGMDITLYNGFPINEGFALVDLLAPGDWQLSYMGMGYNVETESGTSFATPAAAGAAALLRNHFWLSGWSPYDARTLQVNMLLMGDGFDHFPGFDPNTGFDQRSGAGRIHMHYRSNANLTAPWGWGTHVVTLAAGQEALFWVGGSGAESGAVTQWKLAMTWAETNYNAVSDIIVDVRNTCPAGGGPPVVVLTDDSFDIRKRMELTAGSIGGKCLQYRVRNLGSAAPKSVYVADYFHSGDTDDH